MNRAVKLLLAASLLLTAGQTWADESLFADGGELYVHGALRENTCRLEMDSAWQAVDLGDTARADVNMVGKAARPVIVKLYLRDCPEIATQATNLTPLTHTQSSQQPGYQARFVAKADNDNPDLIGVTGATGIGLRLRDSRGQTVKLSRTSDTVLLSPGQNVVTYTLAPERTAAPLKAGAYYALINFSMIYQ